MFMSNIKELRKLKKFRNIFIWFIIWILSVFWYRCLHLVEHEWKGISQFGKHVFSKSVLCVGLDIHVLHTDHATDITLHTFWNYFSCTLLTMHHNKIILKDTVNLSEMCILCSTNFFKWWAIFEKILKFSSSFMQNRCCNR